jgi:broad specificity phosphatase PhoE
MLLIYVRHGDPNYETDTLTEIGLKQAADVADFLSVYGVDQIFSSTANRAIQTAIPTANRLGLEITPIDFAHEKYPWKNMTIETPSGFVWPYQSNEVIDLFHTEEITNLGYHWYKHPLFIKGSYQEEMNRIQNESNRFFQELGYLHLGQGKYKVLHEHHDKVAMFAHQGFGYAFLSLLLNIPYPIFCTHFELGLAEITLIEFKNVGGYAYPKVISLSSNHHLKRK